MSTSSSLIALVAVATYYTTIHQHIITPKRCVTALSVVHEPTPVPVYIVALRAT